jgi:hypothetical protein
MTKQAEDDARGFVHLTHCERLLHPLQNINVSSITMIIS